MKCPRCKSENLNIIKKDSDIEEYRCVDCLNNDFLKRPNAGYFQYYPQENLWGIPNEVIEMRDENGKLIRII